MWFFTFTQRILVQTPKTVIHDNWTAFIQSFSNLAYHLKEKVHPKIEIQALSSHPDVDGKSGKVFVVHNAFLELHAQTALQHSATTTEVDGDLLLCRVNFTNCCDTMWISDVRHTRSWLLDIWPKRIHVWEKWSTRSDWKKLGAR